MIAARTTVSREGLTHIVRNLRERDRQEIFALRWNDDEDQLIDDVINVHGGPVAGVVLGRRADRDQRGGPGAPRRGDRGGFRHADNGAPRSNR